MTQKLNLLLIEDSESDAALVLRALERAGYEVTHKRVETAAEIEASIKAQTWDLVISDFHLPQIYAPVALRIVRTSGQDIPFIVVSGTIGEETAATMVRIGANDYVMKDNLGRLGAAVNRELQDARLREKQRKKHSTAAVDQQTEQMSDASPSTCSIILDSLPAQVAIIDRSGIITSVNLAWREYTQACGLSHIENGVGLHFKHVLNSQCGLAPADPKHVHAAIEKMLTQPVPGFNVDFQLDSKAGGKKCRLAIAPVNLVKRFGAVVMHTLI